MKKFSTEVVGCIAKLDSGEFVTYDLSSQVDKKFISNRFDFIGIGEIYIINRVLQTGSNDNKFYRGPK